MRGAHHDRASAGHYDSSALHHGSPSHFAGRTADRAMIDVDRDQLYDPFVRHVADTLAEGFRGLPTLGELEDATHIVWRAYERLKKGGS